MKRLIFFKECKSIPPNISIPPNRWNTGIENELAKRGYRTEDVGAHLSKNPKDRSLIFGDPSKVKLSSLGSILDIKIKKETDEEKKGCLNY